MGKEKHEKKSIAVTKPVDKRKHHHGRLAVIIFVLIVLGFIFFPILSERNASFKKPESTDVLKPSPPAEPQQALPEPQISIDGKEEATTKTVESAPKGASEEKVIIERYSLNPDKIMIEEGTTVRWVNEDARQHRIACYSSGKRIFLGDVLNEKESSERKFKDSGEYLCLDAIFGSRMNVAVEPMSLSKITGGTVRELPTEEIVLTSILVIVLLITISIYLYANRVI